MADTIEAVDWDTVWKIQRDICSVYFWQLRFEFAGIDGDLPYGSVYNEPYWEILHQQLPEMSAAEKEFLLRGCLFFVVCLCLDLIEGSGNLLRPHLKKCEAKLSSPLEYVDDELRKVALRILRVARETRELTQKDVELLVWFKRETVFKHFQDCSGRLLELQDENS